MTTDRTHGVMLVERRMHRSARAGMFNPTRTRAEVYRFPADDIDPPYSSASARSGS